MNDTPGTSRMNRRDFFLKCARGICIGILAYITGLLTLRYFRKGEKGCRLYTKCGSCRDKGNCSLVPSLSKPKWQAAEKRSRENI